MDQLTTIKKFDVKAVRVLQYGSYSSAAITRAELQIEDPSIINLWSMGWNFKYLVRIQTCHHQKIAIAKTHRTSAHRKFSPDTSYGDLKVNFDYLSFGYVRIVILWSVRGVGILAWKSEGLPSPQGLPC